MYRVATQRPQWHTQNFEGLLNSSSFLIKFCDLSHVASLAMLKFSTVNLQLLSQVPRDCQPRPWKLVSNALAPSPVLHATNQPGVPNFSPFVASTFWGYMSITRSSHRRIKACLLCQEAHRHWCLGKVSSLLKFNKSVWFKCFWMFQAMYVKVLCLEIS